MRDKTSRKDWFLFIPILILGIFLTLWQLNSLPNGLDGDAVVAAANSLHIFDKEPFKYFQNNMIIGKEVAYLFWSLPLGSLLIAICLKIFGITSFAVLFSTAIIGIMTIIIFYLLVKNFTDVQVALLSTFFFVVSTGYLLFSRSGFSHITITVPLICLSFFILLEAVKRNQASLLLWQGLIWGIILFNTYPITFIVFPVTIIYLVWIRKIRWLVSWPFILSILIALLIYAFLAISFVLINGSKELSLVFKDGYYQYIHIRLREAQRDTTLWENITGGIKLLFWTTPANYHFGLFRIFNYPLLNPIISVTFVAGLIFSIIRRNNFDKLLILWLGLAFILSSAISIPQERYLISLLPVPYILSSEFIILLLRIKFLTKLTQMKFIFPLVVFILLGVYGYFLSYKPYFVSYAKNEANLVGGLAENEAANYLLKNFDPASTLLVLGVKLHSFDFYTRWRYQKQYIWSEVLNKYISDPTTNIALSATMIEKTPYEGRLANTVNDGTLGSYWYGDVPDGFEMSWGKSQQISNLVIFFDSFGNSRANIEYGVEAFDERAKKWITIKREIHSKDDAGIALNDLNLKTPKLRFTFYQTNAADLTQRVEEVIIIKDAKGGLRKKLATDQSIKNIIFISDINPNFKFYGEYHIYGELMERQANFFFNDLKLEKVIDGRSGKPIFKIYLLKPND